MVITQAKETIERLVERFGKHIEEYKRGNYNETQTRNDFINPFFEALGWDINNRAGLAESYREVIHEDKIKISGSSKAPDYCFTVYGQKKFFVEAKKPSVSIKDSIDPAYQVRRYGWSAKLPISIVTDFEEFSIYDCSIKPAPTDKASVSRIKYFTFVDYIKEFDFLWETFSKEQVLRGSFDKFATSKKGKKGTAGVDVEFLKSLDKWRDHLARNIVHRNYSIGEDELNYSLQKIIDRLIFLRICEDRGVELENQLFDCIGDKIYSKLKTIFHTADQKYNSGLFDYKKDTITDKLSLDDKVLKTIIEEMYYPKSPYEFSVIPVEILGHSYEQYLGKLIRLTPGHRIRIEEKPEVRKAGGVYYTPQYIVDYIVKNTVGKLVGIQDSGLGIRETKKEEEYRISNIEQGISKERNSDKESLSSPNPRSLTPEEVAKIKICDPACGSGSFLLGAYQYLLDWHREYYKNANIKHKEKFLTPDGNLTSAVKKQILLNNIYGVDIDTNAVEVTKLSLMLKAMEGETEASINQQLSLLHERVLPSLDNNIKSGNSLIDIDFYDNQIDFEPGAEKKIKPFNWQAAFPEVFRQGGFDVVIGNPPYVQPTVLDNVIIKYLNLNYQANTDLYSMFIEKSFKLLNEGKYFGFIVPSLFIKGVSYEKLRNVINKNSIETVIKEQGDGVFNKVQMPTCICLFTKGANNNVNFFYNKSSTLFNKVETNTISTIGTIRRGLEIGRDQLKETGSVICLNGGDITNYLIKSQHYITKQTLQDFNKNFEIFKSPKIIVRETGNSFFATIDLDNSITNRSLYNLRLNISSISIRFLLGILNSKLFKFYFKQFIAPDTNIFPKIRIVQLNDIPIPKNPDKVYHDQLVVLVDTMLQLNKDLQRATLPEQKEQLKARIDYTDKKIDKLVYELYGLTEEEIKIVEGES